MSSIESLPGITRSRRRSLLGMRHVLSEPRSGALVRLRPGDWLEVRLSPPRPGFRWQVVDKPGCLFPLSEERADERPAVHPPGPRMRALGFLAFGAGGTAQRLRLALVHPRSGDAAEVRDLDVVVA